MAEQQASIERQGAALIARAAGATMDEGAMRTIGHTIDEAVRADPAIARVILDLTAVSFIPSLALGLLVQMAGQCKARQQTLRLTGVQPPVRREFAVTRLDRILQFADSVQAAMV